jgi:mono/diheme cytochrome c family protein
MNKISWLQSLGCSTLVALTTSVWADTADSSLSDCVACHTLEQPSAEELTLEERLSRKGPSLYYAGNKYRSDWVVKWLQNPTRIRPGGVYYGAVTEVTDEGDVIMEDKLPTHIKLDAQQAQAAARALNKLQTKSELITGVDYQPKKISMAMGRMNFRKFKGCNSCHQDKAGVGGVSGPEMYTAFQRLQPEFLVSFIKDPTAWEHKSLMPNVHLNDANVHKLVNYLKIIGEATQ